MDLTVLLVLIWLHFLGDFVFQTNDMAGKKSSSELWLTYHVGVYIVPFFWFGWLYAVVNFVAHYITDWITSRVNARSHKAGKQHLFYIGIGFDQAVHLSTLVLTYIWLVA